MSVASEITRLQTAKSNLKASINSKTDSEHKITDETIDEYSDFVDSITTGGSSQMGEVIGGFGQYNTTSVSNVITDGTLSSFSSLTTAKNIKIKGESARTLFAGCSSLVNVSQIDTKDVTDFHSMFRSCSSLVTAPLFDTSKGTLFESFFDRCSLLENIPLYDMSSLVSGGINRTRYMFRNCTNLSNESLNNLLLMCINAKSWTGTKTLLVFSGLPTDSYPVSRMEALPNYQDFLDAGWTLGWE
jgi:hypothetical protein